MNRSPGAIECEQFARINQRALWFLLSATHDYASARCLVLNGMLTGLSLGAQAIEKFLKGYILLKDVSRNVRSFGHSLSRLMTEAMLLSPELDMSSLMVVAEKFEIYYQARYPDNPKSSTLMSGHAIREMDELVVFLNEHLTCPKHTKYRSGLYAIVTLTLTHGRDIFSEEFWIKKDNHALLPLISRIESDTREVMADLDTGSFDS